MRKRYPLLAGMAAVAVLALSACAPEAPAATSTTTAKAGNDTLNSATTTDVVNYTPLVGNSRSDYWVSNLMYPHLLSMNESGDRIPEVATHWGYVDDTTGFYDIRDDMKWSDGEALTAEDVAYTLNA